MRLRSRDIGPDRIVWTRVQCCGEAHEVGLQPFGRAITPWHTPREIRAARALGLLGGEPLGCLAAVDYLDRGARGPSEWRELLRQVRIERNFRHRDAYGTRLWPRTNDLHLTIERRVLRALMRCAYHYGQYAPEQVYYRSTVSLARVPGVYVVAGRTASGPALDVCAVVGPRWLEVERCGLACVDGALVLRLAHPDAGYDVVAARQLEGFDIRPWPASVVARPRGGRGLVWRNLAPPAGRVSGRADQN